MPRLVIIFCIILSGYNSYAGDAVYVNWSTGQVVAFNSGAPSGPNYHTADEAKELCESIIRKDYGGNMDEWELLRHSNRAGWVCVGHTARVVIAPEYPRGKQIIVNIRKASVENSATLEGARNKANYHGSQDGFEEVMSYYSYGIYPPYSDSEMNEKDSPKYDGGPQ